MSNIIQTLAQNAFNLNAGSNLRNGDNRDGIDPIN